LNSEDFDSFVSWTDEKCRDYCFKIKITKERKIDKLLDEKLTTSLHSTCLPSTREFYLRLIDLSDTQLGDDGRNFLKRN